MFFVCHVPVRSYPTFSAVLWNLAVNLPLKQTFVKFDPCNDPIPYFLLLHIVYLAEMRILSYQASWYVSPVPQYAHKRLSWKSLLASQNEGFWRGTPPWDETYRWDPLKGTSLAEISNARVRLCGCPRSHRIKTSPVDNFTHVGSRDPPVNHYALWIIWWSRRRNKLYKCLLWSVKALLFSEVLKMSISYTQLPLPITQCIALPRLYVINSRSYAANLTNQ
jgi:hypothetical protein